MTTRDPMEPIDLDALVKPCGRIKLAGKTHDVLPANGRVAQILSQIAAEAKAGDGSPQLSAKWIGQGRECVRECVPTLTDEEVALLSVDPQINLILSIATRAQANLEKIIAEYEKKDGGPTAPSAPIG